MGETGVGGKRSGCVAAKTKMTHSMVMRGLEACPQVTCHGPGPRRATPACFSFLKSRPEVMIIIYHSPHVNTETESETEPQAKNAE